MKTPENDAPAYMLSPAAVADHEAHAGTAPAGVPFTEQPRWRASDGGGWSGSTTGVWTRQPCSVSVDIGLSFADACRDMTWDLMQQAYRLACEQVGIPETGTPKVWFEDLSVCWVPERGTVEIRMWLVSR